MNQTVSKACFPSHEEALLHRQKKKMSKILKRAWDFDNAMHPFQICNDIEIVFSAGSSPPFDLQNFILFLANDRYEVGRTGWEKFASDLGSLYSLFIRKGKLKHLASKHLDQVCKLLEQVDKNLVLIARKITPSEYAAYYSDSSGFDSDDDLPIRSLRSSGSSMSTFARSIDSNSDDDLPIISLRTSYSSTNTTARSIDSDSDVDGSNFGFSKKNKSRKKSKKVPRKKEVDKKRKANKSLSSKNSKKKKKNRK